jgi:hypothetical protein
VNVAGSASLPTAASALRWPLGEQLVVPVHSTSVFVQSKRTASIMRG